MTEDTRPGDGPSRDDGRREQGAAPAGGAYEWMRRGLDLLSRGDAAAAATLLEHVHAEDPGSASALEALARARFDAGRHDDARAAFATLVEMAPDSDYAHFGLGLSLARLGRVEEAEPHLALAAVMRPGYREYDQRLREVRATRAARRGVPGAGAVNPVGDSVNDTAVGTAVGPEGGTERDTQGPAAGDTARDGSGADQA